MDKNASEYHANQLHIKQWISNSNAKPNSAPPNQYEVLKRNTMLVITGILNCNQTNKFWQKICSVLAMFCHENSPRRRSHASEQYLRNK